MKLFDIIRKQSSPISVKLMLYGTKLAFGVLIIGIAAFEYNDIFIGSIETETYGIRLVQAAFSLFVQFIIGGLVLDCVNADKH